MNLKALSIILSSCVFLSLSLCAADSTGEADTNETQEVMAKPIHVTWGEEAFFQKTWPDAVLYCVEKGQRLPSVDELRTLPKDASLYWGNEDAYVQSYKKTTKCAVDDNNSKRISLELLKSECNKEVEAKQTQAEQFSAKSTGEKAKEVGSHIAEAAVKTAMVVEGAILSVGYPGGIGQNLASAGLGDDSAAPALSDSICKEADELLAKLPKDEQATSQSASTQTTK